MMNILFVTYSLGNGGSERVISRLSSRLSSENNHVSILSLTDTYNDYYKNTNINLITLNRSSSSKYKLILDNIRKIHDYISHIMPDVVISFDSPVNIQVLLASFGLKTKIILSERNDPVNYPPSHIYRLLRKALYPFSNGYVFQTDEQKDYFPKQWHRRSTVIGNPLPDSLPSAYTGKRKDVIVCVSRLTQQKNIPNLIKAISLLPDSLKKYKVNIYGRGDELSNLQSLANKYGISDRCCFMGFSTSLLSEIRDASLFVLPSNYEGMPNALLEAMSIGLPCVSTDCPSGGPRSIINPYKNGLLVPVNNPVALSKAIETLLSNKKLAEELGKQASKIKVEYNINIISDKWIKFIKYIFES